MIGMYPYVLHGVVENYFRICTQQWAANGRARTPNTQVGKNPVARQKFEHRERVVQTLVRGREQKYTQALESFDQPARALDDPMAVRVSSTAPYAAATRRITRSNRQKRSAQFRKNRSHHEREQCARGPTFSARLSPSPDELRSGPAACEQV